MNIFKYLLPVGLLKMSWGDGQGGDVDTGDYSSPTPPNGNGDYTGPMSPNWDGGGATGDATYQSSFLQNLFNNPETAYGEYGNITNPVVGQAINAWAPVREGMATLTTKPSMFGDGALRQEYDANGEAQGFMTTPFAKGLMDAGIGLGRSALNSTPLGAIANVGYDMSQGANPMRALAGAIPGYGGMVARGAVDISNGAPAGQVMGNAIAGPLGSQLGGQMGQGLAGGLGGALGSMFGGRALQGAVRTAGDAPQRFGLGDAIGGLAGLYGMQKGIDTAGNTADSYGQTQQAIQQQMASMPTLDSMYGQNSPYAQQMRQSLARQDAKAGRNSQYGQREVQLQAALADKASTYAAQQAGSLQSMGTASQMALKGRMDAQAMQDKQRAQQLGSLYNLADKSGALGALGQGLSGMWSNFGPSQWGNQQLPDQPPQDYEYA